MRYEGIKIKITARSLFYLFSLCLCVFVVLFSLLPNTSAQNSFITIRDRFPVVNEGNKITLIVIDGNGQPVSDLSFQSGSPEIASVDQAGVVSGVRQGFATITASKGDSSDSVTVAVTRINRTQGARVQGDIKVDTAGRIYISDPQGNVILRKDNFNATANL